MLSATISTDSAAVDSLPAKNPQKTADASLGPARPMAPWAKRICEKFIERLRDLRLISHHDAAVALCLLREIHNSRSGWCAPSHADLSKKVGLSLSTVRRSLLVLQNLGVLSWHHVTQWRDDGGVRTPWRAANQYFFFVAASISAALAKADELASGLKSCAAKAQAVAAAAVSKFKARIDARLAEAAAKKEAARAAAAAALDLVSPDLFARNLQPVAIGAGLAASIRRLAGRRQI